VLRFPPATNLGRWLAERCWPQKHFENLYAGSVDPWQCQSSFYELRKLERTLQAIEMLPFGAILDVGCGEGLLAERLGRLGWPVLAVDASESAVGRARDRCAGYGSVRAQQADVCEQPPSGSFSVIVLAEVLYYLRFGFLRRSACNRLLEVLDSHGAIVAVNPWPAAPRIERALRQRSDLVLVRQEIVDDPGRPYSITTYGRFPGRAIRDSVHSRFP
jgi:SAM-dependent methyltransferase